MAFNNAKLSTVSEIRSVYQMIIPEYQRGYAWNESQWSALWEDACNVQRQENREHYAGAIMVSTSDEITNQLAKAELIDGQQRWTSIALMLKALGDDSYDITYINNEPLQTCFDYHARGQVKLAPRLAEYRSYYTRNMSEAAAYFQARAQEVTQEQRAELVNVLLDRFKIFTLEIHKSFNVHVAFETINNRGKSLSTLEKLKNRLVYLAANAVDRIDGVATIEEIHRCWKSVYTWLGQGSRLLDDDEFLRAHALAWFRHEKRADWLTEKLFDEEFSAHSNLTPQDIQLYVQSLEHASLWWYRLNEPTTLPSPVAFAITKLQRTASASTRSLILWALISISKANPELDRDPFANKNWCQSFVDLVEQAERFAVLVVHGNDRQSNIGQSDFYRSAYALAHPSESLYSESVLFMPSDYGVSSVQFATRHMKALVTNRVNGSDEYSDEDFSFYGYFDADHVKSVVADRLRKSNGFYKWQLGKLMIYLWEENLRGEKGLPEKRSWETIAWDETVEHIYPQNPVPIWSESVSFDGRTSSALRNSVVNSLGNLLLLSSKRNPSVSNNPYVASGEHTGKVHSYKKGCYSEVQIATMCKKWTVVEIAARGIAMWRLAQKTWDFELVPDNGKLVDWLPYLFGDQAGLIQAGKASHDRAIDGRTLTSLVERFESHLRR